MQNPRTSAPSFGDELRRERVVREVSLEEISAATKISLRLLSALERSDLAKLPGDGGVELRVVVAVQVRPNGRIGVEILAAARVPEHGAAAGDDHNRLAPQPIPHLRKRVPDMGVIETGEPVHCGFQISDSGF